MNYKATVEFLFAQLPAYHRIGKAAYKNNLDNTLALDDYFRHPHRNYRTIHIAGTNGKGSVSHMLASVLMESGFRTGLYTSPHLKDFRERIRVDGKMIPKSEVTGFVKKHSKIIESLKPSFFELTAAMAFDYFSGTGCDIAVIETGMGGRLDSTNIISPVISVITNIGHDHMDLLGGTLEKVAYEKAGIIKNNIPVVIGESLPGTKEVFIQKAEETGSEIYFADDNYTCFPGMYSGEKGEREFRILDKAKNNEISGKTPLGGDYQARNLQTLFQVCDCLKRSFDITDSSILNGIRNVMSSTGLMGRWQVIRKRPLMICDTGHNKEGIEYVTGQIERMKVKKVHFVIGFVNDKDLSLVLPLFPQDAEYYFTKASVPRALDENILQKEAFRFNLKGESYPSVKAACEAALKNASAGDMIFVGGSTFVVADVL
jgi:dihydrofolate synthase/folylpolyglutamate synthase